MLSYRKEIMSNEFTKHLLYFEGKAGNFHLVVHHFTAADIGGPHDHPYSFQTHILKGSYVERVYNKETGEYKEFLREAGTTHFVEAETIHELVDLPDGECWTTILPGPFERHWGFWKFDEAGSWFRLPTSFPKWDLMVAREELVQ